MSALVPIPTEVFSLFDRADDEAIIAKLRGAALKAFVYHFPQKGQEVYGLSAEGAEAAKRELAKTGEVIEEEDISIEREDAESAYFKARVSRWAINKDGTRIKLDSAIGLKRQPKHVIRRDGSHEANSFWFETGGSKAMRNAILKLVPEEIQQRVIEAYKGTAHERKVVMDEVSADILTHEAYENSKELDERRSLVYQLQERWRDLGLMQSAVKLILEKKGLSAVLATRNADWSTVDLAVIRDLLAEAS